MSGDLSFSPGIAPRTINVGIETAGQTASYTLPPGIAQYVEAVYAEIDNGAGTIRPMLSVLDQSGVVIATKSQSQALPTGSGSATWALRLADDGAADTAVGTSSWVTSVSGQTIPDALQTFIEYDTFQFNGLGLTTVDNKLWEWTTIGAADAYMVSYYVAIGNPPFGAAHNWVLLPQMSSPELAYLNVLPTLTTDYDFPLWASGPAFFTGGTGVASCEIYQDSGAPHAIGRRGFSVTYLGQYA